MFFWYTKEFVSVIEGMKMDFSHSYQVLHIDINIYAHLLILQC